MLALDPVRDFLRHRTGGCAASVFDPHHQPASSRSEARPSAGDDLPVVHRRAEPSSCSRCRCSSSPASFAQGGVGKRIVEFARAVRRLPWPGRRDRLISCTMFGGVSRIGYRRHGGDRLWSSPRWGAWLLTRLRRGAAVRRERSRTDAAVDRVPGPRLHLGVSMRTLSMAGLLAGHRHRGGVDRRFRMWYGRRSGVDNGEDRSTPAQILTATKDAGPALLDATDHCRRDLERPVHAQ